MSVMCGGTSKQTGKPCGNVAGYKTAHVGFGNCFSHGGNSPSGIQYAERLMAEAAVTTYGLPREIDPHSALLEELHRTAGHVAWLQHRISEMRHEDDLKQTTERGDGTVLEAPAVWLKLYDAERKHFTAIAKTCVDVGIEERRIQIAEQQGQLIAEVLRGVLTDLGLEKDKAALAAVRRHLTLAVDNTRPAA